MCPGGRRVVLARQAYGMGYLMAILGTILSWVIGGGLSGITDQLRQAYKDRLTAANDEARIEADLRIKELEAQRSVIVAAQQDKVERWVRVGFALPFIVYNAKLLIWDKVMAWGSTDPLSSELMQIQMTVLGGYFLFLTAKAIRK